jgi:hypothetical protein
MHGQQNLKKKNWTSHLIICVEVVNLLDENINMMKQTIKLIRTLIKTDE